MSHPLLPAAGRLYGGPCPLMPFEESIGAMTEAGITTVVSLLERHESRNDLEERYRTAGFTVVRFPITDYGTPAADAPFTELLHDLVARLHAGERLYVHCMGGIGRTGTVFACLLKLLGADGDAVALVRSIYRPHAVESPEQRRFIAEFYPRGGPEMAPTPPNARTPPA